MNHTGHIRHCHSCMRHTPVETVPAVTQTRTNFVNGVAVVSTEEAIPEYQICTHCGEFYGYRESA